MRCWDDTFNFVVIDVAKTEDAFTLVEEYMVLDLLEKGLEYDLNDTFIGVNLHSEYFMLCPEDARYWLPTSFFGKIDMDDFSASLDALSLNI